MLRTPCSSPSPPAASRDCNRRAGFYYDELLKKCINCTTICGQHPRQCAPTCESKAARKGRQSGDVGQDAPGLGWKRSQVMGLKLGKGQQTPFSSSWGGCVVVRCHGTGTGEKKSRASASLRFSLAHNSIMRCVLQTCPLAPPASAVEFLTLLSCLQPLGSGSGRGQVIFPEICNSHIGVETRSLEKGEEWEWGVGRDLLYLAMEEKCKQTEVVRSCFQILSKKECASAISAFPIRKLTA